MLLARTFFARFFESDLLPPGMPQAQVVIWSLAFLAAPGLILPVKFMQGSGGGDSSPQSIAHTLLVFRLFFITLTMTAIGFVALMIWDGIFPDRRDARILTPLPVPGRVLIGARFLALGALCGIFVVGINAVPTVFYAPRIAALGGTNQVQGILAFAVANGLAGTFVFTTLVALQGLALNLGGKKATDRVSLLLQVLFVMALLQMIFFMGRVGAALPADLNSGWLRAMPSVWFLGLYDLIGGRPATGAPVLAMVAVVATATTVGGAVLLFVGTHARLTRRALESRDIQPPGRRRHAHRGKAGTRHLPSSGGARSVRVHAPVACEEPQPSAADGDVRRRRLCAHRLGHRADRHQRRACRIRSTQHRAAVGAAGPGVLLAGWHACRDRYSDRAESQLALSAV